MIMKLSQTNENKNYVYGLKIFKSKKNNIYLGGKLHVLYSTFFVSDKVKDKYTLLTKHEGCTWRISAQGLDSTKKTDRELIFS